LRHVLTRVLAYDADALFRLVSDVEAYPQFIRWINALRIIGRWPSPGPGVEVFDAQAEVAFGPIRERFSTRVVADRPNLTIAVTLISGPFRRLENHWRLRPIEAGTELAFEIDIEMRSALLGRLLAANFERVAKTLVGCFESRAAQLYGGA
jgi:coenzyme Q-binding protein COQ10